MSVRVLPGRGPWIVDFAVVGLLAGFCAPAGVLLPFNDGDMCPRDLPFKVAGVAGLTGFLVGGLVGFLLWRSHIARGANELPAAELRGWRLLPRVRAFSRRDVLVLGGLWGALASLLGLMMMPGFRWAREIFLFLPCGAIVGASMLRWAESAYGETSRARLYAGVLWRSPLLAWIGVIVVVMLGGLFA